MRTAEVALSTTTYYFVARIPPVSRSYIEYYCFPRATTWGAALTLKFQLFRGRVNGIALRRGVT